MFPTTVIFFHTALLPSDCPFIVKSLILSFWSFIRPAFHPSFIQSLCPYSSVLRLSLILFLIRSSCHCLLKSRPSFCPCVLKFSVLYKSSVPSSDVHPSVLPSVNAQSCVYGSVHGQSKALKRRQRLCVAAAAPAAAFAAETPMLAFGVCVLISVGLLRLLLLTVSSHVYGICNSNASLLSFAWNAKPTDIHTYTLWTFCCSRVRL